jgi:Ca2+-binding EF-hand superfamily protein
MIKLQKEYQMSKRLVLSLCFGLLFTLPSLAQPRGGERFDKLDLNNDGKITLLEMQTISRERFKKGDKNNDGFINTEEVLEMMPFFVRNQAREPVSKYLKKQDLNKDGKVSLAEVLAHAKKRFEKLDSNKNGSISESEFKAQTGKMEL